MDFSEALDQFLEENHCRMDSGQGVKTLCIVARALGDPQYFGQLTPKACIGDFLKFLEDNPGAIEAVIDWVREQDVAEWADNVESELQEEDGHGQR
jgi:hypothetical protein